LFTADGWFWSGVVADKERIYIPNMDGNLYAWGIQSQEIEWKFDTEGSARSTPVLVDDLVMVASDSGNMYKLYAANGTEEWTFHVEDTPKIQAPLMAKGSVIYIATLDHTVSAVDIDTNRSLRKLWPVSTKVKN
jgi:outer membrane protein assembly factor BamB